jgi:Tfp pilus assembly protein PilF
LLWCFQAGYAFNWHPLTWISHMLDCQLFGVRPGSPHAINALLHAVNSALLFLVLKQMTGAFWRSAIVAALFAWHPLRAESVAWVSERKDVLGALLWILSLWAYVRYAEEFKVQSSRFKVFYGLALVFFALGLMAKPMVITLPFLLLVLDGWPLNRLAPMSINSSRRLLWEKAPFFLLAAGSAAITMKAQSTGQVADLRLVPIPLRLSNSLVAYAGYLEKIFWPAKLSFMYPLNFNLPVGFALAALGLLVCISVVAVLVWRNSPYWLAGWFWYLGMLLPVIGLVQVGAQSMADRYSYLPSIGIFIIVCWTAEQFTRRWRARKILLGLAAALTLGACALLTNAQLKYWRNSETLFRHALAVNPNNYLAHFYYGRHLRQQGKWPLAELEFQQSIALMPTLVFSYTDLSDLLAREGKTDQAMVPLRQVLKIRPDLSEARCALAALLFKQQLLPQAETELEEGLKLDPEDAGLHQFLGHALAQEQKFAAAEEQFAEAVRLDPNDPAGHYQWALALAAQHKNAEAISHYRDVLQLTPDFPNALNNLAWLLASSPDKRIRNGPEAIQLALRACALTQTNDAIKIETLANAYAESGCFDEAAAWAQKAHDIALAHQQIDIAAQNLELKKLFQSHRAYYEYQ